MGMLGAAPAQKLMETRQFEALMTPPTGGGSNVVATSTEMVDEVTFLPFNKPTAVDQGHLEPDYIGFFADLTPLGNFLNKRLMWECSAFLKYEHYAGLDRGIALTYREYLRVGANPVGGGLIREFVLLNDSKGANTLRFTEIHTNRKILDMPVTPYSGADDPVFRSILFYAYQDSGIPLILESGGFQVTLREY